MSYDLQRFVEAQNDRNVEASERYGFPHTNFEAAKRELACGQKESHWMWYIFPQLKGLSISPDGIYYAIENEEEAESYMKHPLLRQRYLLCLRKVFVCLDDGFTLEGIFGELDAMKFRSSLELFAPYL